MLKSGKIAILTLFIVTCIRPVIGSEQTTHRAYGNYEFIYPKPDSILVDKLFETIRIPLQHIEWFFGNPPGSRLTIYVTKSDGDFRKYSRYAVPEWSQAVAFPNQRLIVLRLSSAEEIKESPRILLHELVHIILAERIPDWRVPRWLNEGLAQYLSGERLDLQKKIALSNGLSAKKIVPLSAIDSVLSFSAPMARLAYLEALSAVEYFVNRHGEQTFSRLVRNYANNHSLNRAFKQTVGYDFIDFELDWFEDLHKKYRWLVVLNLDNLLWITMGLLAILAIIVIRYRNRKKINSWDEEEDILNQGE